jgi:phosphomannomutase / phosphoglucomutase
MTTKNKISKEIFRAYDIRGIAFEDLTENVVRNIGQALGTIALRKGENTVVIAKDGRISGPALLSALSQGIMESGCDVLDIGTVPTPILYFATKLFDTNSGVMLTGSHNPANYNGLKIIIANKTLFGDDIQAIYTQILNNDFTHGNGAYRQKDITSFYLDRICGDIQVKRNMRVAIDCGNGVAGSIAPTLLQRLNCETINLFCDIDGNFPNHPADPSQPANLTALIDTVKKENADFGIAFDGDGDRIGIITEKGEIIWPDKQLMLFAIDVLSRNKGAEIVYDVKCTRGLDSIIKKHGGVPIMYKTGHSFIKAKLKESPRALLAGEMSGHMFFKERWYGFDDALYAAARFLEIVAAQEKSVSAIFAELPHSENTPELRLPVAEAQKFALMKDIVMNAKFPEGSASFIDGIRVDFTDGFGLIRPSNTTPYLIMRFEADNKDGLSRIQNIFKRELLKIDAKLQLPF